MKIKDVNKATYSETGFSNMKSCFSLDGSRCEC